MHGLINRSVQNFLNETYSEGLWRDIARSLCISPGGFEPMLHYPDSLTEALIDTAAARLGKPRLVLLEDLGAHLVSIEPLRRLLRFGGVDFSEFVLSLDELEGRGVMTLPELELPSLVLCEAAGGRFRLEVRAVWSGWVAIVAGLLRAMADDYGALALIEIASEKDGVGIVNVTLHDARFAEGRRFDLAQPAAVH
jgi:hypothetical protein